MIGLLLALAMYGGHSGCGGSMEDELSRLRGQQTQRIGATYTIVDIAGLGSPNVGRVQLRGRDLWLIEKERELRLTGPLAIPRIAGPGYKVWVLGTVAGHDLRATRIGILAPPCQIPVSRISTTPFSGGRHPRRARASTR